MLCAHCAAASNAKPGLQEDQATDQHHCSEGATSETCALLQVSGRRAQIARPGCGEGTACVAVAVESVVQQCCTPHEPDSVSAIVEGFKVDVFQSEGCAVACTVEFVPKTRFEQIRSSGPKGGAATAPDLNGVAKRITRCEYKDKKWSQTSAQF